MSRPIMAGDVQCVEAWLCGDGDVNVPALEGRASCNVCAGTLLISALARHQTPNPPTLLIWQARTTAQSDPTITYDAHKGQTAFVEMLLRRGARTDIVRSPRIKRDLHSPRCPYVLGRGLTVRPWPYQENDQGCTALSFAAGREDSPATAAIKALLEGAGQEPLSDAAVEASASAPGASPTMPPSVQHQAGVPHFSES